MTLAKSEQCSLEKRSSIDIADRLLLGEGLFETLLVRHSSPQHASLHWERLNRSAKILGIPFDVSLDSWLAQLQEQIQKDELEQGGLKVILSAGKAPRGLTAQGEGCHLLFQTFSSTKQIQPLRLTSSSWLRDASNPLYSLKSVSYLEAVLARKQAIADGFDDVLFYNMKHHATETTCSNLFIIQKNNLLTSPLEEGVLAGVTRFRLLNWCQSQDIACLEMPITQNDIKKAEAAFLTNAIQLVQVVKSIDDVLFDTQHPLLNRLMQVFNAL